MEIYDGIIIGAGPAGLSAGIYLARFKKKTLIIDAEKGRSMLPGTYGNIMGFFDPVERTSLRRLGAEQAKMYGAEKVCGMVTSVEHPEQENFKVKTESNEYLAKNIIFCTGVMDNWPQIKGYEKYVGHSIHSCPICAGYESSNQKIIVTGEGSKVSGLALYMLTYTDQVTIVTNGHPLDIPSEYLDKLNKKNIPVYTGKMVKFEGRGSQLVKIILDDGNELDVDVLFTAFGVKVKSDIAKSIGIKVNDHGYIIVDSEQKTNIEGVYAAGDVTSFDSKQVVTAMYEGFMAAKSIFDKLLKDEISNI